MSPAEIIAFHLQLIRGGLYSTNAHQVLASSQQVQLNAGHASCKKKKQYKSRLSESYLRFWKSTYVQHQHSKQRLFSNSSSVRSANDDDETDSILALVYLLQTTHYILIRQKFMLLHTDR